MYTHSYLFLLDICCLRCCCERGELWLLAILLKTLLIMLSWYSFFYNTCFILAFSLCKSSLFVLIDYPLLYNEEATLFLQLVWWWKLYCRYWSICVGFLCRLSLFCFNKVSRNVSSPLLSSFIVSLIFWWRL